MYIRRFIWSSLFVFCALYLAVNLFSVHAQYACNTSCALDPSGCALGLTCRTSDTRCGKLYNQCGGASNATCYGNQANGGWDFTDPCNQGNLCNNAGTTRTFGWGAAGACTASCGPGTRPRTCNCGSENNCTVSCTSPAGACGAVDNSITCCIDQAPQSKPTITSVGSGTCGIASSLPVTWTFNGTSGCGNDWGYTCGGNTNSFTIKVDGVVNTAGISSALRTFTITTTQTPSHQIQVCANNGFAENCSDPFVVTMDANPPPVPIPTLTLTTDGSCVGKSFVDVSWAPVVDSGCGGLPANPYWVQASTDPFNTVLNGWYNSWQSSTNQTSTSSYDPGTVISARVRSKDVFGDLDSTNHQSAWSSTASIEVPVPSPYPTIHIAGTFQEDFGGGTCIPNMILDPNSLNLQVSASPNIGVTANCTKNATSYACNVIIDNQSGLCVSPNTTLTVSGVYTGYSNIGWREGNSCSGAPVSLTAGIGNVDTNVPIFFTYGGGGVQPTPPGGGAGGGGGWFKLSNSGFINRYNGRQNFIPSSMSAYDSDDSVATRYPFINTAGSLVQSTPVDLGPNGLDASGNPMYSAQNWYTNGYSFNDDVSVSKYIDYVEARRQITKITSLSEITNDGIYISTTPLVISTADLPVFTGKRVVLVAKNSSITITNNIDLGGGALALVGSSIDIDPSVSEINAVILADSLQTGVGTTPLKVKGNVSVKNAVGIYRVNTDARKPSLFVVYDPSIFVNLIEYLSTNTYDWKQ